MKLCLCGRTNCIINPASTYCPCPLPVYFGPGDETGASTNARSRTTDFLIPALGMLPSIFNSGRLSSPAQGLILSGPKGDKLNPLINPCLLEKTPLKNGWFGLVQCTKCKKPLRPKKMLAL